MTQNKAPIYPYYLHDEKGNVMYDPRPDSQSGTRKITTLTATLYGIYAKTAETTASPSLTRQCSAQSCSLTDLT